MKVCLSIQHTYIALMAFLALVLGCADVARAAQETNSITIATGRVGGIYHPVGGAICKLVNEGAEEHGVSCTVKLTSGSLSNITELRNDDVDLALAQSDLQFNALKGATPFEEAGPFDDLRAVFSPYIEHFTIVTRPDADIDTFDDLKDKRVYMGPIGSGRRPTMNVLMEAHGWSADEIEDITELKATNRAEALCDNEFDAYVSTIGHPSPMAREAATTCGAVLTPITGPAIDKLIEDRPYFITSVIPGGTYRHQSRDVPTIGVVATLLTTAEADSEVIYQVTRAFFENHDRLVAASPLFSTLTKREKVTEGITAPLHDGATKYLREAGLQQ